MQLRFYTTSGCHLCEDAWALLQRWAREHAVTLDVEAIEIAEDEALMARYGIRIPVIADANGELDCPFGEAELNAFLNRGRAR